MPTNNLGMNKNLNIDACGPHPCSELMLFKNRERALCYNQHRYQNEDLQSEQLETRIQTHRISTSLLTLHQSLFVVIAQHLISLPASFHHQVRCYRRPGIKLSTSSHIFIMSILSESR